MPTALLDDVPDGWDAIDRPQRDQNERDGRNNVSEFHGSSEWQKEQGSAALRSGFPELEDLSVLLLAPFPTRKGLSIQQKWRYSARDFWGIE
jgi:hypothetical protein